jgi:hypothetical protein
MVLTAIWGAASCAPETTEVGPVSGAVEQAVQSEASGHVFADPASRWRLIAPKGTHVRTTRFDPSTPANKVKERFEVREEGRLLVRVDIWANPAALDPLAWIHTHATYLQEGSDRIEARTVSKHRVRGIVVEQPPSCQAPSLHSAVFSLEEHMVAVTCADAKDDAARRAFETVLGSFGMEERR